MYTVVYMKPPQQKKRVKAWAIIHDDGIGIEESEICEFIEPVYNSWLYFTFDNIRDAQRALRKELPKLASWKIVPCTIEYSLPPKSKKRRAKTV